MLKANELRIGNYLYDAKRFEKGTEWAIGFFKVFYISIEKGFMAINTKTSNLSTDYTLEPISLTPEILEKCGFVPNYYNVEFTFGDIMLDCEYTDKVVFNVSIGWCKLPTYLKYLHQLQNLYFALTGEELEVIL